MKKQILLSAVLACISVFSAAAQKEPVDYVNPFVGTTNYGTTNPGALTPHGMMSVTPFNVSPEHRHEISTWAKKNNAHAWGNLRG